MDQFDKDNSIEKRDAEALKEQIVSKPKLDLGKILTDAAMRHPKEVNNFLDEYVGSEGKSLILSTLSQTNPTYGAVIEKLFPIPGQKNKNNRNGSHETEEQDNPLDDNDPEKDYEIPDTEILNEIRQFACDMHLSGYGWSQISDSIFQKYDVDWNPLKIKDIVLKNLAWNHRTQRDTPKIPPQATTIKQDEQKGIIRRFVSWLW